MLRSMILAPRQIAIAASLVGVASLAACAIVPAEHRVAAILLSASLSWASVVDAHRHILPNVLTLGLIVMGAAYAVLDGPTHFIDQMIAAYSGFMGFYLMGLYYARRRGRDGLGLGDAKLLGAAGAWLGLAMLPYVALIASASALAVVAMRRLFHHAFEADYRIAFGPYLAGAFWVLWLARASGAIAS